MKRLINPGGYYVNTHSGEKGIINSLLQPPSSMHQKHRVGGEVTNSLLCQVLRLWLYKDVWGRCYAPSCDNCCAFFFLLSVTLIL